MTEKVLSTLALVSALVLTLVYALPTAVTYEELISADQRFSANPPDPSTQAGYFLTYNLRFTEVPSRRLALYINLSGFFLTATLITVILQYMFLSFTNAYLMGTAEKVRQKGLRIFHNWNKWVSGFVLLFVITGIVMFFIALWMMFLVKFPDYPLGLAKGEKDDYMRESDVYVLAEGLLYVAAALCTLFCVLNGEGTYRVWRMVTEAQIAKENGVTLQDNEDDEDLKVKQHNNNAVHPEPLMQV
eukprot:CAMPEP_0202921000 /NCGR_PEP_ID=MMETSP1392-20130828/77158_1 /ASSEMBLY_ACC=CAM_ASM_000868 /TAXON_ID=225041 /ORGANISM="Chlamydomonas chlamydogama, Strain SAG 11-48b" /LENGTH=243 /DNA_ID=CAMNT_0049614533 /DNA_START=85 /DNA_END=816 /DNA_ORIENTATION=+